MNIELIKKISIGLNRLNCTWAIGGSVLLNHYGLIEKPKDIDILIDPNDVEKVKKFMDTMGQKIDLPSKEPFKTEEFFGYIVEGTMVEFLGGFKIDLGDKKIYEFILDESAINKINLDGVTVNMATLEDWFVAYSVMEDPKGRMPLIEEYFRENGIENNMLLKRNLKQYLPSNVSRDIERVIN